jgi:glycosyltransferase A (GT-A) superfamily protein (DUF2064 family)
MDRDALVEQIARKINSVPYKEERRIAAAILDAIAPAIRAAALEQAAQVAEEMGVFATAEHIRALINAPPPTP